MEDIVCTIPEQCNNKDCPLQWHLAHYWQYDDGSYTVCDTDGNHDPVESVPTSEEAQQAWQDYYKYMSETGLDPVNEWVDPRPKTKVEVWQVRFRPWIGQEKFGVLFVGARKRGRGPWLDEAPQYLADFLNLKRQNRLITSIDYTKLEELHKVVSTSDCCVVQPRKPGQFFVKVDAPVEYSEESTRRLRRAWARNRI